jgi:ribosome biogenesis protein ENP2
MEIQERRSGKIYSLASSSTSAVPEWLSERSRRNLSRRDSSFRHRISLLQDLDMPISSSKIRQSSDGNYLFVSGTYAPRIRCYELSEMAMKFERYVDSEVIDMCVLGSDYGKLVILGADRTLTFHAPYGNHEKVRLPTFGRAMAYDASTCDLMVVSSGRGGGGGGGSSSTTNKNVGEVYRFNLDEGRFSMPYSYASAAKTTTTTTALDGASSRCCASLSGGSCIAISPTHSLSAIGAEDGTVRFWDNRVPPRGGGGGGGGPDEMLLTPFLNLDVSSAVYSRHDGGNTTTTTTMFDGSGLFPGEVTSLCFDDAGMRMCAGTRGGNVALYDMRSSRPLFVKEHQYGLPIHTVQFHSGSGTVLSVSFILCVCVTKKKTIDLFGVFFYFISSSRLCDI